MESNFAVHTQNTIVSSSYLFQNPHNFEVGCLVQYEEPAKHGVIKWIGTFPDDQKLVYAGLEVVNV